MSPNMNTNTEVNTNEGNNEQSKSKGMKKTLLLINAIMLAVGNAGGPLILRFYYLCGGKRRWLSTWLETGGWPIIFIPLSISYIHRQKIDASAKAYLITPAIFAACAVIGVLTGLDDYMYASGSAYLPVSTSALLISSQLAFQAVFALLIVRQKFTPYSINSIVLLTVGAIILGLHTSGDRPAHETRAQYFLGFFLMLAAAALYGCVLPLIELMYMKAKQTVTYTLVMEIQMVMGFFATAFATVGMLINNDFKVISREAKETKLTEAQYYVVLVSSGICWQFFFLGTVGVIATSNSLHAGVLIAVLLPVNEILAVIFFKENFNAEKGISLGLSLWGFASYLYGEYKTKKIKKQKHQPQVPELNHP